jgi:hypothetical protein
MPRSTAAKKPSRDKVRAYRARQRRKGLRLVQMWLPDTRSAALRKEAARQSRLVAASERENDAMNFIDAITDGPRN